MRKGGNCRECKWALPKDRGATALCNQGVQEETIRTMGRWRSDVARQYMRQSQEKILEAGRKMASN